MVSGRSGLAIQQSSTHAGPGLTRGVMVRLYLRQRRRFASRRAQDRLLSSGSLHGSGNDDLSLRQALRPDRHLLAILPLGHEPGDEARAVSDRVGERVVLAVELGAADRTLPVGLLERIDELVRLGGPCA